MTLSPNAMTVLNKRYLLKDAEGNVIETPNEMWQRVAATMATVEANYDGDYMSTYEKFHRLISSLDFTPNSPTIANAGARTGQLSACFVLPVPDDLRGIFETVRDAALIHQTGGGTGFSFSRLRRKGAVVRSSMGESSGPISFMEVFNTATDSIKQGGMRRGANMGILRVDHPDILDFIDLKGDLTRMTNFNVSVAITDAFMQALADDGFYMLIEPSTGEIVGQLKAADVFARIVKRAHATGEPGIVFIDRMNQYCPVPWIGQYESTNPCGEQPLIPYESCNLGSINVENFVKEVVVDGGPAPTQFAVDWARLAHAVHDSTHFLENVIDANRYPLKEIADVTHATRKIGLGVMGFARLLFRLGIPYGSEASFVLAEQLFSFIDFHSKKASIALAKKRGWFPAAVGNEAQAEALQIAFMAERTAQPNRHPDADYSTLFADLHEYGIRNSTTTTIAPTGTISIFADTSGGCEPVFALAFKRWQADAEMLDYDKVFRQRLVDAGLNERVIDLVMGAVEENHGSLKGLEDVLKLPKDVFDVFVTSHDITPEQHIRIQAAFQKYNDSATSKTINFPESATEDDVRAAYELAWSLGCKGVTVYRNNSRKMQPLSVVVKPPADSPLVPEYKPKAEAAEPC